MAHKCCSKQKVKRGLWSPEEDERLVNYMTYNGHACWSSVPRLAGLQRCGKSCRLRWINYLRPELKRGTFTAEEEQIIIDVHRMLGNRWSEIAKHLPGRTDNEVKNYWNSCIKKKLVARGLDPKTHTLFKPNAAALPVNKLKRPNFKLHKSNSHISYTADQPYDAPATRLPSHQPQKPSHHHRDARINDDRQPRSLDTPNFDHIERSYMDDGVDPVGIFERDGAQVSHSSSVGMMASVREDCFTNFGLELDLIDDVIRMDHLLWNSTFPT